MNTKTIQDTTKAIVWVDLTINILLGFWLSLFPEASDRIIGTEPVLSIFYYRMIGFGLLLFAAWQIWMIVRKQIITRPYLVIAIILAVLPIIALTSALLLGDFPLVQIWKTIIWIGDGYMVLLTTWYLVTLYTLKQ